MTAANPTTSPAEFLELDSLELQLLDEELAEQTVVQTIDPWRVPTRVQRL